jgi:hypothetical protein
VIIRLSVRVEVMLSPGIVTYTCILDKRMLRLCAEHAIQYFLLGYFMYSCTDKHCYCTDAYKLVSTSVQYHLIMSTYYKLYCNLVR